MFNNFLPEISLGLKYIHGPENIVVCWLREATIMPLERAADCLPLCVKCIFCYQLIAFIQNIVDRLKYKWIVTWIQRPVCTLYRFDIQCPRFGAHFCYLGYQKTEQQLTGINLAENNFKYFMLISILSNKSVVGAPKL